MANRGLTGTLLTEVQKKAVTYVDMVFIDVNSGYYLTNNTNPIVYDSNTYEAFGQFLSFDTIEENIAFEIPNIKISISGIPAYDDSNNNFATTVIGANYTDKDVKIYRKYFNEDGTEISGGGVIQMFEGTIQDVTIVANKETCVVELTTASHWVDFDRQNGRFTNENSQKSISAFSADDGLQFARDVQKEIEWKA
jgi:hypothetical protein